MRLSLELERGDDAGVRRGRSAVPLRASSRDTAVGGGRVRLAGVVPNDRNCGGRVPTLAALNVECAYVRIRHGRERGSERGSPCGRRRTKLLCGGGNLSVYATAFNGLEEGAFDLERFRGNGRQLRNTTRTRG